MIVCRYVLRFIGVAVLSLVTDAVLERVGAVSGSKAVVDAVEISGVII